MGDWKPTDFTGRRPRAMPLVHGTTALRQAGKLSTVKTAARRSERFPFGVLGQETESECCISRSRRNRSITAVSAKREERRILGGADVEDFAFVFVVTGDAGLNSQVGASLYEQLNDFGVDTHEMGQRVKDWSLSADAVGVDIGVGVDVGATVEKQSGGVEEAIFGRDMQQGCAAEEKQTPSGGAAI